MKFAKNFSGLLKPSRWLLGSVLVFLSLQPAAGSLRPPRSLTFADRVKAQEAIERVYYSHQIDAKESFESAVPRELLEQKVRTTLKHSEALEKFWNTAITSEALSREVQRMEKTTRLPDRLRELFAALEDDPYRIQECLARPLLAERLIQSFYANDQRFHASRKAEADELQHRIRDGGLDPRAPYPGKALLEVRKTADGHPDPAPSDHASEEAPTPHELTPEDLDWVRRELEQSAGGVGDVREENDRFIVPVLLDAHADRLRIAEYTVAKIPLEDWWRDIEKSLDGRVPERVAGESDRLRATSSEIDPATASESSPSPSPDTFTSCLPDGSWDGVDLSSAPSASAGHTAVWTGSLMIVWGGTVFTSGGRYDPATDSWSPTSIVGAPAPRKDHTAVWTGAEMLVWGGRVPVGQPNDVHGTGGRYNPLTDTWSPISTSGAAPVARAGHTAVWTGNRMIVWGGTVDAITGLASGALYDPTANSWQATAASGVLQGRYGHTAIWTGTAMIVWGGANGGASLGDGARYTPSNPPGSQWSPLSNTGAPTERSGHTAVWTGSRMVVWGGGTPATITGGLYDPSSNSWAPTATGAAPLGSGNHVAVWTGSSMLVWGGGSGAGGRYNPATDVWSALSSVNAPKARSSPSAVWTGSRMIVWGGSSADRSRLDTGGRYDPATDTWTPTSTGSAPLARFEHTAVWTGNEMIVWGGFVMTDLSLFVQQNSGGRYDPATNSWRPTSVVTAPIGRVNHTAVWTGSRMIIWGGSHSSSVITTGGRYDPIANSWAPTSTTGAPYQYGSTAVWTGSQMVVWGGGVQQPGGRYNPATDTWTAVSLINAPIVMGATAVWDGSRMIVWGGGGNPTDTNQGARYDPVSNTWTPTSLVGAPLARSYHHAVWTGSRMIIAGGVHHQDYSACHDTYPTDGGLYDPATNTWTSISGAGSYQGSSSVWTGTRMILWGGQARTYDANCSLVNEVSLDSGSAYNPSTNTWTELKSATAVPPPATMPPVGRWFHSALWSGSAMVVWGGLNYAPPTSNYSLRDGGRLVYGQDQDGDGDGFTECTGDCNDANPGIHPGATEVCDGIDEDCDGKADNGFPDIDADGYASCGGDCNDSNPAVHPGASETCNGVDDDCDGLADNIDLDQDGYNACVNDCNDANPQVNPGRTESCNHIDDDCDGIIDEGFGDADGDGFAYCVDCNDGDPAIHPGAPELCNGVDDDCDGAIDDGFPNPDGDGDGFPRCSDCNDTNPSIHPGAPETCNGLDDDCDGTVDEGFADPDGDGFAFCTDCNNSNPAIHPGAVEVCNGIDDDCDGAIDEGLTGPDGDGDGYLSCGDCNDANPAIHPGAAEICNGVDDDCDGTVDEGFDQDGDGFSPCAGDCNDANPNIHPGAFEACNGIDDDCDGATDESSVDADGDGFRVCDGDCNDANPAIHPGAIETCNGVNDDCDGTIDEGFDLDADGFTACGGDCNDNSAAIHPGAAEVCNNVDDDCDGIIDDGFDVDADGFSSCGGDCNDGNPAIHPGASEACNGVDDDCNAQVDDAPDVDGDGVGSCVDCSEVNPMVWLPPVEVENLQVAGPVPTYFQWDDQSWVGPETIYDISTGSFGPGFGINLSGASCLQGGVPAYPYSEDMRPNPAKGTAYWYLVRARNSCGTGGYGTNHLGQARVLPPCP